MYYQTFKAAFCSMRIYIWGSGSGSRVCSYTVETAFPEVRSTSEQLWCGCAISGKQCEAWVQTRHRSCSHALNPHGALAPFWQMAEKDFNFIGSLLSSAEARTQRLMAILWLKSHRISASAPQQAV